MILDERPQLVLDFVPGKVDGRLIGGMGIFDQALTCFDDKLRLCLLDFGVSYLFLFSPDDPFNLFKLGINHLINTLNPISEQFFIVGHIFYSDFIFKTKLF